MTAGVWNRDTGRQDASGVQLVEQVRAFAQSTTDHQVLASADCGTQRNTPTDEQVGEGIRIHERATTMNTTIVPFSFDGLTIRTVSIDGQPWFVAADVASILGYSATAAMTRSLDDDERGVQSLHTPSGFQEMTVITEAGLYSAALRSTIPQARAFKRWITSEVLPAIRRTGTYSAPEDSATLVARALIAASDMLTQTQRQLDELKPRAQAWDELAGAAGDFEVADAAKMLARAGIETGRQRLFDDLHQLGWIYRGPGGKWKARQTAVDAGHLVEKPQSHHHPRTNELVIDSPQVRVTVRGLERLRVKLGAHVVLA